MSELPKGWVVASIADITNNHDGQRVPVRASDRQGRQGQYPYYGASGIIDSVDDFLFDGEYLLIAEDGANLLARSTPIAFQAKGKFWVNNHAHVVTTTGTTSQSYVEHYLNSIDLAPFVTGSAQPKLTQKALNSIPVALAPTAEQRRIVAKLDSLRARSSRAGHELDLVPKLIERYKQAILAKAFSGELTADWRRRHSQLMPITARELTRKQLSNGNEIEFVPPYDIPKTWRWLKLPELGNLDRGRSRHRPRNDTRLFGGKYPFVQTGEVRAADRYLDQFEKTYSDFGLAQSRLWPTGTVCITIAANIAETAILKIAACFPDSVVGFTADNDRTTPEYIEYFVRTVRGDLERFAPATAQKNINLEILYTVGVPSPSLEEQNEIVRSLDNAFSWLDKIANEHTRAAHLLPKLDQAILAKAFRGELVPQDPNDEPASVLLERIKTERDGVEQPKRRRARSA